MPSEDQSPNYLNEKSHLEKWLFSFKIHLSQLNTDQVYSYAKSEIFPGSLKDAHAA
jgi:hypothetical protein